MRSKSALTKLQVVLLIDLIIVASAVGGFFYVESLPAPLLDSSKVQLSDLRMDQGELIFGQSITVSVNVTNIGTETGRYVANLTVDDVPTQPQTVELASSETKVLEFAIANAAEGIHSVKIGNLEGAFTVLGIFKLSDLAINRTEAKVGEPIGITIKVTNRAEERKDFSLALSINGSVTDTKTGQLDGGATANVLYEVVEQREGTYQFMIGNLNGTFRINPSAPPPKPAEFQVANLTIDPDVAEPGMPVNVTAKITNVGEISGNYSVDFTVNSEVKGNESVQLAGGETTTVSFLVTETVLGNYTIKIGNATGTLSVQPPSTIKLTNIIVRPYEVWAGETVTITARATNPGAQVSSLSLKLQMDGEVVEAKTLTLAAGADGSLDFSVVAPPLKGGDSTIHMVDLNGFVGGFMVVKNGYHTLAVAIQPNGDAEFTLIFPDGQSEKHRTFYTALLPVGTYTVAMPTTDPTGVITFSQWEDGSKNPSRRIDLSSAVSITATYIGGTSCPALYMWNGTSYVYVADVSNHGWLGYINYINQDGSIVFYRNNPWDYVPLDSSQLQPTNGNFNLTLQQKWNEIFYLDQAYMMVVDHPANVNVYSTMVEQYLDPNYMGQIYTVSKTPLTPVSAFNEKGQNVLPQISAVDGVFTPGINGIQSPSWDNITWNRITLDLGKLSGAKQIKLVVRAIVDWGSGDDYNTWLNGFFAQPVPNGTQITPPPYMEVKDANGNWMRIPESREFPLPPDGTARTYIVDLTGLFPTSDYSLRISNFWNVTFDYIGVDTTPQQNVTIHRIDPQAYLYQAFTAGDASATGNFTKYGNVTQLVLKEDDEFVIGKQGDAVSLQFSTDSLSAPAQGMVRDYFLFDALWFKDTNGNWGFGFGFTVDPLPFRSMSGFPYPPTESYPYDAEHSNYLAEYNTRTITPFSPMYDYPRSMKPF